MAPHKLSSDGEWSSDESVSWNEESPNSVFSSGSAPPDTPLTRVDERSQDEPIAIIGMGMRLPGEVDCPSKLWELLIDGRSAHSQTSSTFNASSFYHPNADQPGSVNSKGGYFLNEDARLFDNSFFGINNMEAKYMDPQQRKLLEVVFECFENAGISLEDISGSNTGCYVANFLADYVLMQSKDPDALHRYSSTGMGTTILANRISHVFNMKGPSFAIDTACSSSVYSLHTACNALRAGECDSAIVAGSNLIQSPEFHIGATKAGILSETSTCHCFDASADGYGRAEGIGAIYIKRLNRAVVDGDPIRCVIRGSAVNSNGKTPGITQPSADGQESVMRKAYEMANLTIDQTEYIEAHGTGTPVGDPIEVDSISRVFRKSDQIPIRIGSVKSNFGHSEAVSGLTSIMKMILALEHNIIPATVGVDHFNPALKLQSRNVKVVTEPERFHSPHPRVGVNSFGYGGANAHVILDSAKAYLPETPGPSESLSVCDMSRTFLIPISAHSQDAIESRIQDLRHRKLLPSQIRDLAYTLCSRRSHMNTRGFILAKGESMSEDLRLENLIQSPNAKSSQLPLTFVFTGQGAQWPTMGCQLMEESDVFLQCIRRLDVRLSRLPHAPNWNLESAIREPAETSQIAKAYMSQPVCTAVQIALLEMLRDWGICPQKVVGHSSGEIAAAVSAGFITPEDGIVIAYYRGYVVSQSKVPGAMMAVGLSQDEGQACIDDHNLGSSLRVACVNSPQSITISGDVDAIEQLLGILEQRKTFARQLRTDGKAYHSSHMSMIGSQYEEYLSDTGIGLITHSDSPKKSVSMLSSVTGGLLARKAAAQPQYWRSNLESPVLFAQAMEKLLSEEESHIIEIGPHSALELPIKQIKAQLKDEGEGAYMTVLSRGKNSTTTALHLAGQLYLRGLGIDLSAVNQLTTKDFAGSRTPRILIDLPKYRWKYGAPLWAESRFSSDLRHRRHPKHDLLGSIIPGVSLSAPIWRNILRVDDVPWLDDHKLGDTTVFPATGYLAMAIEAFLQMVPIDRTTSLPICLQNVNILQTLPLSNYPEGIEVLTSLRPKRLTGVANSPNWWEFEISSLAENQSNIHATGTIGLDGTLSRSEVKFNQKLPMQTQKTQAWYDKFTQEGLVYGPEFQALTEIRNSRGELQAQSCCTTKLRTGGGSGKQQESEYFIHPITMDMLMQTAGLVRYRGEINQFRALTPVAMSNIKLYPNNLPGLGNVCSIRAVAESNSIASTTSGVELLSSEQKPMLEMRSLRLVLATGFKGLASTDSIKRRPMLRVSWKPDVCKSTFSETHLTQYLHGFVAPSIDGEQSSCHINHLAGMADLICHKYPSQGIMEIGDGQSTITNSMLAILHADGVPRFSSYTQCLAGDAETVYGRETSNQVFTPQSNDEFEEMSSSRKCGILLCTNSMNANTMPQYLTWAQTYMSPGGFLIFTCEDMNGLSASLKGYRTIISQPQEPGTLAVLAQLENEEAEGTDAKEDIILVEGDCDSELAKGLVESLPKAFSSPTNVRRIPFKHLDIQEIPPKSTIISTIEYHESILTRTSDQDMTRIKKLTNNAANLVWVTTGGTLKATNPNASVVLGLSRSLMLEHPSLKFTVLDIGTQGPDEVAAAEKNIAAVVQEMLQDSKADLEYLQHDGALYCSRFIPETRLNDRFRDQEESRVCPTKLGEAGRCKLAITEPGQFDTIHFVERPEDPPELALGYLEVKVKSMGLNAKDLYALKGKLDVKNSVCAHEFSGIVSRVGSSTSNFAIGDKVVAAVPNQFNTFETVPEWACVKLTDDEDFQVMSAIPVVYMTALYALRNRANLQPGESVLVHSAAGGFGTAAIQVARHLGAGEIYATVGSEAKKDFVETKLGIPRDYIFNSRDSSFANGILEKTKGVGVDVILNSLTGPLLHDSWKLCADFGRFIEIGKRDILDTGRLDMDKFKDSVTFSAFDLAQLIESPKDSHHRIVKSLIQESVELFRQKVISVSDSLAVYDISKLTDAYRRFQLSHRIGKVAVSLENSESMIPFVRSKFSYKFNPDKAYLMIGCLGGLGRSISRWMMTQGARRLVFMSRSGADSASAKEAVESLNNAGGDVTVLKGDVSSEQDLKNAISQIKEPIGGVVSSAMALDECLFASMTSKSWQTCIDPKVWGTWNLHNALRERESELDLFLMTSSLSGSVGTATESNYCAANAFQDAFARYRRGLGLKATALGIGMVSEIGYLAEHPEIEALLLRRGLHPIKEDELMRTIDIALSNQDTTDTYSTVDHFVTGHVLTGMEPQGLRKQRRQGFEGESVVLNDPRCDVVAKTIYEDEQSPDKGGSAGNSLPSAVAEAIASQRGKGEKAQDELDEHVALSNAVQTVLNRKLCHLLLLKPEQLGADLPLGTFGMDSMLAAEFRTFVFNALETDISFQTLLEKETTVAQLTRTVVAELMPQESVEDSH